MKGLIVLLLVAGFFFYISGGAELIEDTLKMDNESKFEGEWESVTSEEVFYTFYESGRFIKIAAPGREVKARHDDSFNLVALGL